MPNTRKDTARQREAGAEPRHQRNIFERAHIHEAQIEPSLGHEAGLHAAGGTYEEDFSGVARDQFAGYGERGNNVPASASSGNEYAQFGQSVALRVDILPSFADSPRTCSLGSEDAISIRRIGHGWVNFPHFCKWMGVSFGRRGRLR